jgi:quercetin dioxygenase-like cupin family protein
MDDNMKYESDRFVFASKTVREDVGGGILRQIMGYNDALMLARAEFGEGSIGYTHSHPHAQLAYVESGVFEFTIGDETATLKVGDCAYVPPGVEHGAICKEAGVLLDIFSPLREDFLQG